MCSKQVQVLKPSLLRGSLCMKACSSKAQPRANCPCPNHTDRLKASACMCLRAVTCGGLSVLAGAVLPGDLGFFSSYLIGSIILVVMGESEGVGCCMNP